MTSGKTDTGYAGHWRRAYDEIGQRLPGFCANARPLLAGFSACVDKTVDLHRLAPALALSSDSGGRKFLDDMLQRASEGRGGETLVDWPGGPAFLDNFVNPGEMSLGGTSSQAAWTLATVGAPAILALENRSADQIAVVHPGILFANEAGTLSKGANLRPTEGGKPAHYIIEYFAGGPLNGFTPSRSTRVIVRFADEDIERDENFLSYARAHGADCGPALLSSPNAIRPDKFLSVLEELKAAASDLRSAGVKLIHLELGDFARPGTRDATIEKLGPVITSLGLNRHELEGLQIDGASASAQALNLARRLGLTRVAVHADDWALTATRSDPNRERDALMLGCLLASARASAGKPVPKPHVPEQADFSPAPHGEIETCQDGWFIVAVPAPFLRAPISTLGLGDTFTAGTMLAHAQPGTQNG